MLAKHRGQQPHHWDEGLNNTLQTCARRLGSVLCCCCRVSRGRIRFEGGKSGKVHHSFGRCHRWSSMTDVEIPSLKAGAATLKASWAQTPRRFWTEEDWCPSEAARPQVRVRPINIFSIFPTDECFCVWLIISSFTLCLFLTSGGYKGYGLGMMVEVFCGILAGAHYSSNIRTWKVTDRVANLVQDFCVTMFCG